MFGRGDSGGFEVNRVISLSPFSNSNGRAVRYREDMSMARSCVAIL